MSVADDPWANSEAICHCFFVWTGQQGKYNFLVCAMAKRDYSFGILSSVSFP